LRNAGLRVVLAPCSHIKFTWGRESNGDKCYPREVAAPEGRGGEKMRFEVVAPNGCDIRSDKRLKRVIIRADNAQDEKDLYELMGHIQIVRNNQGCEKLQREAGK
jgi:hypothetical protein